MYLNKLNNLSCSLLLMNAFEHLTLNADSLNAALCSMKLSGLQSYRIMAQVCALRNGKLDLRKVCIPLEW